MKADISFNEKKLKKKKILMKRKYKCDDTDSAHTEQFKCLWNKILLSIINNVTDDGWLIPKTQTRERTKHI